MKSLFLFLLLLVGSNEILAQEADSLFTLGRRLMLSAKKDSAELIINKGIALSEKNRNDSTLLKLYLLKANLMALNNDNRAGLTYLAKAAPLYTSNTPYTYQEQYNSLAGLLHRNLLSYDSAIYYFHENEKLNNIHNPYRNWLAYYQMANTFQVTNIWDQAELYYWKSYEIVKTKKVRGDYGLLLNEFSGFLSSRNKPDTFAMILREYNDFLRTSNRRMLMDPVHSVLYINMGEMTLNTKVDFMKKVKYTLLKNGDEFNAAYANNYLAGFYEENKQYDEAVRYIEQNLTEYKQEDYLEYQYANTRIYYRLLKKMNRDKEAIAIADTLIKLKEIISNAQQRETVTNLEMKYQSEKKEKEIALLNSQNELNTVLLQKEIEIKKRLQAEGALKDSAVAFEKKSNVHLANENTLKDTRLQKELELKEALNRENALVSTQNRIKENQLLQERKLRGILIGSASLLLLAAVTILYLYRRQKSKNLLIQKQANELEILMKEIHHRVKNNMQIVSSLLDLQSNTIKDSQAAEAVKEGKNRVQSMAIIHQHLYQEGNIRGIKMDEYIGTLTQNLFSSYNINPDRISLKTDIEKLNLDVDTVIPLGLIINELVSNSLKYAFDNVHNGIVSISLKEKDDCLELLVKDDGRGFPSGLNIHKNHSFGLQLITAFAQKLKARLDFYNDNGAAVFMQIKKFRFAGA
jgi:two-component sensor histidine kinase